MNRKTGLEYFSFDVDFFQDEKIQFVSARFGLKGEAIAIRLLCKIYRHGYYMDWDEDTALLFAKGVGDVSQHSCVKDVVFELLKRGFFDRSIFERFSVLTSQGIQRRYFDASVRRKAVKYRPELMLIDVAEYQNLRPIAQNVDILPQNVDILGENVDILPQNVDILGENVDILPQSKVKNITHIDAALKTSTRAREKPPPASAATAPPSFSEYVISPDCLDRYHAYCAAWNALGTPIQAFPGITHYASNFAQAEHQTQDVEIFGKVIARLQANAPTPIHTGKVRLAPDYIFTAAFANKVLSGYYDLDYSNQKRNPQGSGGYEPTGSYEEF